MQFKPKKIKFNLFNFKEQNKSKTIKAIDLKPRLKVAHIRVAVPNEFSDCTTTRSERTFSSHGHKKNLTFLVISRVEIDHMSRC